MSDLFADRRDALANQRAQAVNRVVAIAAVDEAICHSAKQADGGVDLAKKKRAGI